METQAERKVRREPYLSMNGTLRYMCAQSASERERILLDYKYPEPEGEAQAAYYGPARDGISRYLSADNDGHVIDREVSRLSSLMSGASQQTVTRLENNIRALNSYRGQFHGKRLSPTKVAPLRHDVEGVMIRMAPDMAATERKRTRLIRFAFAKEGASIAELRYSAQMLHLFARLSGLPVTPADCALFVVADGTVKQASGTISSFEANLRGAMREVRHRWPHLEDPRA